MNDLGSYLLSYQVVGSCVIDAGHFLSEHFHRNSLISEGCLIHFTKPSLSNDILCAAINKYNYINNRVELWTVRMTVTFIM